LSRRVAKGRQHVTKSAAPTEIQALSGEGALTPLIDSRSRAKTISASENHILARLSKEDWEALEPHMELVSLKQHEVLSRVGEAIKYAYFPQNAVLSFVAVMKEGTAIEVGLIGHEGMVGFRSLLGATEWPNGAQVEVSGDALRMRTEMLKLQFDNSKAFHDGVLYYMRYFIRQVTQTAACNRVHHLDNRLCRWLLMVHDRAKKNAFAVTHEYISNMLGTNRSEVTLGIGRLHELGLIKSTRGLMEITDRKGLEKAGCECYEIVESELEPNC
jgi:CRP-like cAMP-binding protein